MLVDQYSYWVLAQKLFRYTDENAEGNVQTAVNAWSRAADLLESDLARWLEHECLEQPTVDRSDIDL